MKVVFAGPSIHGVDAARPSVELRGPAAQGAILEATLDGATVIGLIDGWFGHAASVWHKEIAFALDNGVSCFGASSMGALRAAECQDLGMVPVGRIALAYARGEIDDDAAVALTCGPAELGYPPFVEPLVDVWSTLEAMRATREITDAEAGCLCGAAGEIFFADRTVEAIVTRAFPDAGRRRQVLSAYEDHRVLQKQADALELLDVVESIADGPRMTRASALAIPNFRTSIQA